MGRKHPQGDVYPSSLFTAPADSATLQLAREDFMDRLFADMLGFGACKMIRRIVGFAHVIDFERIADPGMRADCEAGALTIARTLLTQPGKFRSINGRDRCRAARTGFEPCNLRGRGLLLRGMMRFSSRPAFQRSRAPRFSRSSPLLSLLHGLSVVVRAARVRAVARRLSRAPTQPSPQTPTPPAQPPAPVPPPPAPPTDPEVSILISARRPRRW